MEQAWNTEFLNNTAPVDGQAEQTIKVEDYKNLQSEFTKSRQSEIDLAIKLARKDKSEILNIKDYKIQSKVIKELYGLDNLEDVKLIHWEEFYKEKETEDGDDSDELTKIRNELKLLKYSQNKSELENSFEEFKKENKDLFLSEWAEERLKEELKYISSELPTKERIKRAAKVVFAISPTDAAYLSLVQKVWTSGEAKSEGWIQKQTIEDAFKDIFKK